MSAFACCFWWFLLGLLLGWLLNWLLSNLLGKSGDGGNGSGSGGSGTYPSSFKASNEQGGNTTAMGLAGAGLVAGAGLAAGSSPGVGAGANAGSAHLVNGVDVVAAASAGFSVKGQDDIIIIEGIGPKIKELFGQNGVTTFAQVSKLSIAEMSAILDKGGSRFKMANPGSWAEQARLAFNNEWAALKKLQDELYAGVAVSDDDKA